MDMITKRQVKQRIAELSRERDDYIDQANARIAHYNGRIAELQQLSTAQSWWKRFRGKHESA